MKLVIMVYKEMYHTSWLEEIDIIILGLDILRMLNSFMEMQFLIKWLIAILMSFVLVVQNQDNVWVVTVDLNLMKVSVSVKLSKIVSTVQVLKSVINANLDSLLIKQLHPMNVLNNVLPILIHLWVNVNLDKITFK